MLTEAQHLRRAVAKKDDIIRDLQMKEYRQGLVIRDLRMALLRNGTAVSATPPSHAYLQQNYQGGCIVEGGRYPKPFYWPGSKTKYCKAIIEMLVHYLLKKSDGTIDPEARLVVTCVGSGAVAFDLRSVSLSL